jgi:glutathione-specific gamma-glutamylcyclotransferase
MPRTVRQMRLTAAHVAKVARDIPDPGPPTDIQLSTDEDFATYVRDLRATQPVPGEVWIFAYGSLIWKPACEFVEIRTGLLHGWHRSFCLGWNTRHRGSADAPGLMLYRLPPDAIDANLEQLVRREMGMKPSSFPPRWVKVATEIGPIDAITFCIDRRSGRYVAGLSEAEVAAVLAKAVGSRGSMAEYLHNTVAHLEQLGIHDGHLWRLQEMVADLIDGDGRAGAP